MTSFFTAATAALQAAAAYYNYLRVTAPFRYHEQADDTEDKIAALRKSTSVADQLYADQLLPRVLRLRKLADKLANLSTPDSAP